MSQPSKEEKTKRGCLCGEPTCAKCLFVNCKDENCVVHTKERKERFKRTYHEGKLKFLNEEILSNPPIPNKEMRLLDEILIKMLRESNQQIRDELRAFLKKWEIRTLSVDALEETKINAQIQKLQSAKTGDPVTLTGYAVFDEKGKDTGKRFIRREDAEKYSERVYGRQNKMAIPAEDLYEDEDLLIKHIKKFIKESKKKYITTSQLQRKFRIGYVKTVRVLDILEAKGFIGSYENGGKRKVLK